MKLNKADIFARFDNDTELVREVIELFQDSAAEQIKVMRNQISGGDSGAFASAAHSIKGAVSNFSPYFATETAAQLEALGRAGDLSEAAHLIDQFEREVGELVSFIEQALNE